MPELTATLTAARDIEERKNRFLAAIQGIDLDGSSSPEKGQKEWEDMQARVFSGGMATDSNDIISLQGINAAKAGFGIGDGLDYISVADNNSTNPFG